VTCGAKKECETFKGYENQSGSGCHVAGAEGHTGVFGVGFVAVGLAALRGRRKPSRQE
jgi:hypothetical protein